MRTFIPSIIIVLMSGLIIDAPLLYSQPAQGALTWTYQTTGSIHSSPAFGPHNTIYVGSRDDSLHAINPDSTKKWAFPTGGDITSSPAVDSDGSIYVGSHDGYLYAVNDNGTEKWRYATGDSIVSTPAIGPDGVIYVGSCDDSLHAINTDGTRKWVFGTGDDITCSPAVGSDGTIYFTSYDSKLYAVYPEGTLKWDFNISNANYDNIDTSPIIGEDGTIYVGVYTHNIEAISFNGDHKWQCNLNGAVNSSPAIGLDGTIYVGCNDSTLYAINPNGSIAWSFPTFGPIYSSPAVGSDSVVYFGSNSDSLYAVYPNGTLKWAFEVGSDVTSSPNLSNDGNIYVGAADGKLYAVGGQCAGVADTPWPKFHHAEENAGYTPHSVAVRLVSPSGDDFWKQGTTKTITWWVWNEMNIDIEYSPDNGNTWQTLATDVSDTTGGYEWDTPADEITNKALIRVSSSTYEDVSHVCDSPFSIDIFELKWTFNTGGNHHSSLALGEDGTIYIASTDSSLYALNPDGTTKWRYWTDGSIYSSPAVGADGTIYIASSDEYLHAIDTNGIPKWTYNIGPFVSETISIGPDSVIYVGENGTVHAVNPDGTQKRTFLPAGFNASIGPDGMLYVGSADNSVRAVYPEGGIKWEIPCDNDVNATPVIGPDGTIYVGSRDSYMYAIAYDGTLKWSFDAARDIFCSAALDTDGTLYFGARGNTIYALNPDGTEKWTYSTTRDVRTSPIIGANGTIYVAAYDSLYALNDDGSRRWAFKSEQWKQNQSGVFQSSPVIGSNGSLYFATSDGIVYALHDDNTGLADTPWPKYHRDSRNTSYTSDSPALRVTSPPAGGGWIHDTEHYIIWEAWNVSAIDIEFSSDDGQSWTEIATGVDDSLGSYQWTTPSDTAGKCYIRITDVSDSTIVDMNNAPFSIVFTPELTLESPSGGDTLVSGQLTHISWSAVTVDSIAVYYSANNGDSWNTIEQSLDAHNSPYTWLVPDNASDECLLKIIDVSDSLICDVSDSVFSIISSTGITEDIPERFELSNAYPNPFNPTTTIEYALPNNSHVRLTIYNLMGQEVVVLVNEECHAGYYSVNWNATGLSSGVYFYRIEAGDFRRTKKMVLMK